jgi:DNA modification methylase
MLGLSVSNQKGLSMTNRTSKPNRPAAPGGLTDHLSAQSRKRRETQRALTATVAHAALRRNDLSPLLKIDRLPIDSVRPATRRVRRAEAGQIAKIMSSIRKFGLCAPILISRERAIVHGHLVWEAARQLGIEEVSCLVVEHLSPSELRMLTIALNRLGETGTWDFEAVRLEFQELTFLGEDMVVTGFEAAEIDMVLVSEEVRTPDEEAAEIPPLGDVAVSRIGDVWLMGEHKLAQGDARDAKCYAALMGSDELAQLVLTDVPYNISVKKISGDDRHREFAMASGEMDRPKYGAFNRDWMSTVAHFLIDGGVISTAIDWRNIDIIIEAGRGLGLDLINLIVWSKSNAGQGSLWRSAHELYPIFKKGKAPHVNNVALGRHGRWRSNIWTYPGGSSLGSDSRDGLELHPTVKPRAMLEDALYDVTNRGDIVIDCFCGSGSMVVAAEATGRRCRAIEIDGLYCDVIIERWQAMTRREAILESTGETFARVAEARSRTVSAIPAIPNAEGGA